MQGERRRFLKWKKMVQRAKERTIGPLFVAWRRVAMAQSHYNRKLKREVLLEWRVNKYGCFSFNMQGLIRQEVYQIPSQHDKLSLQLTSVVAYKETQRLKTSSMDHKLVYIVFQVKENLLLV